MYEEIKARILDGTYAGGASLASTRAVATERGLSRTTVSTVYDQLAAEGFLESRRGAASRVAAGIRPSRRTGKPPPAQDASAVRFGAGSRLSAYGKRIADLGLGQAQPASGEGVDFMYGPLAGADFPTLAWMRASRKVERERPPRLEYADPRGDLALRRALQSYLARARGISCDLDQLLIVSGSQQALDLCARVLVDPGDRVVVEDPGYRMAHHVFRAYGARLHGIAVDSQGLRTDDLARVRTAVMACVTPTHQFPLGAFLSMPRRRSLLQWAAQTGAWILEDDYDSEYRYAVQPEATLQSMDETGCVIYIGTFSKTLSPELRLGYMVIPSPAIELFTATKRLTDRHSSTHAQRTLALLLHEGTYDWHVRRIRRLQDARRTALLRALHLHLSDQVTVVGASSGLHLVAWAKTVPASREEELVAAAWREGVHVYPVSPLYLPQRDGTAASRPAGLILGYALLSPEQIDRGVKRLAAAILGLR
ncbi:PLP-dependent aminotransferase family protein [Ramlibacter monticola]|uniref:MocR-like pyridoxine biosynthesis transcription factor PdxR n=1 Tax=Ramlibacter monticola TaxID=1926872 RepID=UPI001F2F4F05|nr:PLP-dependent aminotransferase family protein [Ramlibacter monticola]